MALQLPEQVIGQRTSMRSRVLDRGQSEPNDHLSSADPDGESFRSEPILVNRSVREFSSVLLTISYQLNSIICVFSPGWSWHPFFGEQSGFKVLLNFFFEEEPGACCPSTLSAFLLLLYYWCEACENKMNKWPQPLKHALVVLNVGVEQFKRRLTYANVRLSELPWND